MAIRIIDGNPGSGKSYYLVKFLRDNYYDKIDGEYVPKDGITVISNIDDLALPHLKLGDMILNRIGKGEGAADRFFEYQHQTALTAEIGGSLVYAIDEAQRFWRSGDKTKTQNLAYEYFEMHRHLGHDVFLCTQESSKLPKHITSLPEFIITAAPRSRSILGEFRYFHISDGLTVNTENLIKDTEIFSLYKSMDRAETVKVRNPLMPKIFALCGLVVLMIGGGYWYIQHSFSTSTTPPSNAPSKPSGIDPSPGRKDIVEVPISSCTLRLPRNGILSTQTFYVVADYLYLATDFPFPIRDAGLMKYASIPRSMIPSNKADSERSLASREDKDLGSAAKSAKTAM